jgi:hypothetical protein
MSIFDGIQIFFNVLTKLLLCHRRAYSNVRQPVSAVHTLSQLFKNHVRFSIYFYSHSWSTFHQQKLCSKRVMKDLCNENQLDALFILSLFRQSASTCYAEKHNMYQLLDIYSIPPGDGLQICPKHVEADWRNKLRINSASGWFSLHRCIEMHSHQNIKS